MSTASTPLSPLQQELSAIEQVGVAAASPFIHSSTGQAAVQTAVGEVNLGIAVLPLLGQLFANISALFHHAHAASAAAQAGSSSTQG